jgi:hypothetical protein
MIASALLLTPSIAFALTAPQDTIVRNAGAPRYPGVATLVQEISIGAVDGPDEYIFGNVADIALGKDGAIYVLDRSIGGIRMYDANGKYLRTIGRRGQGPGEIMSPSGITTLKDGRLLLWETGLWRVNVYSATGDVLTHWSFATSASGTAMMSRGIFADTADGVYIAKNSLAPPNSGSRPRFSRIWLRLRGSDGAILDTVREPTWPREPRLLDATNGNMFKSVGLPFDPVPLWRFSPFGYIVSGFPDRYAFELRTRAGSVTSVRRDVQPTAVSSAERDSARRAAETSLRETQPTWSWGSIDIPRTKPLYQDLLVGLDGRVWIARVAEVAPRIGNINSPAGVGRGAPPPRRDTPAQSIKRRAALYDVFEPSGAFIGAVEVPPGVSTVLRRGDYVWGVAYDEDDVAFVRRYRIIWK